MLKHSEYLNKKKDYIAQTESLSPELYDFYMHIFLAQEDFASKCGKTSGFSEYFRNGQLPVLNTETLALNDEVKSLLNGLMLELTDIISKMNQGMNFSLLKENFNKDANLLLRGLLNKDYEFLEKKGFENRLALDEFIFVVHNVFKPFMVLLRQNSEVKIDKGEWLESSCPFCGYLPDMSKIVESKENKRNMHCAICENEWEFPRLICPSCGCNDQTKNGFFEYEDNNLYRVYYCDECKHYVKNVRIPKLQEESSFDLAVEDIITNFLDSAMIDKGYRRI